MSDLQLSTELESNISSYESRIFLVKNNGNRNTAIDIIKEVKSVKSKVVGFFKESRENAHKTWKAIVANEKTFTDRLDMVEKNAKASILSYDKEQEEIQRKEQARLQAIADAEARRERDRLLKRAESLKTPEKAEALREEAESVVAPVVQVSEQAKSEGVSTSKTWKAEVVKVDDVPREWMIVDMKALDAFAKATKGTKEIAGIRFYKKSSLSIKI